MNKVNLDMTVIVADMKELFDLLQVAGPNPLLIDSDEYWDRYVKITNKYFDEDENEA